jgi:hypothetical protein
LKLYRKLTTKVTFCYVGNNPLWQTRQKMTTTANMMSL